MAILGSHYSPYRGNTPSPSTITVSAKHSENKWFVTCTAERQGEQIEMATYSRRGENPMMGMCCFVEDWDRRPKAEGLLHGRMAW